MAGRPPLRRNRGRVTALTPDETAELAALSPRPRTASEESNNRFIAEMEEEERRQGNIPNNLIGNIRAPRGRQVNVRLPPRYAPGGPQGMPPPPAQQPVNALPQPVNAPPAPPVNAPPAPPVNAPPVNAPPANAPSAEAPPTEEEIQEAVDAGINPFNQAQLMEWVRAHRLRKAAPPNNIPTVNPWVAIKTAKTPFNRGTPASNIPLTNAELLAYRMGRNGPKNSTKKEKKAKKGLLSGWFSRKKNNGNNKADKTLEEAAKKAIRNEGGVNWNKNAVKERMRQIQSETTINPEVNPFLQNIKTNAPTNAETATVMRQIEANKKNPFNTKLQKEYVQRLRGSEPPKPEVNPFTNPYDRMSDAELEEAAKKAIRNEGGVNWNKNAVKERMREMRKAPSNEWVPSSNKPATVVEPPVENIRKNGANGTRRACAPKSDQTRKLNKKIQRVLAAYSFLKDETSKLEKLIGASPAA